MTTAQDIIDVFEELLEDSDTDHTLTTDTALFDEGLGLDSLRTAELSALLEEAFGDDPFSDGLVPQTIGEVVAYYAR